MKSTRNPSLPNQNNQTIFFPSKNQVIQTKTTEYKILNEMEQGNNAHVHLVKNLTHDKLFVSKKQKFDFSLIPAEAQKRIENEEKILKALNRLEEVDWINSSEKIIIQSYFPGISLKELSDKKINISQAHRVEIINKCLDELNIIHQLGWIHVDLQPSNVIVNFDKENNVITKINSVKIIDFGHALPLNNHNTVSIPMSSKINPTYYGYYFYVYLNLPKESPTIPFSKHADFYAMGGLAHHALALSKQSLHSIWNHSIFVGDSERIKAFKAGCDLPLFNPLLNKH